MQKNKRVELKYTVSIYYSWDKIERKSFFNFRQSELFIEKRSREFLPSQIVAATINIKQKNGRKYK